MTMVIRSIGFVCLQTAANHRQPSRGAYSLFSILYESGFLAWRGEFCKGIRANGFAGTPAPGPPGSYGKYFLSDQPVQRRVVVSLSFALFAAIAGLGICTEAQFNQVVALRAQCGMGAEESSGVA